MADWRKIRAATFRSWLDGLPEEIYDKRETSHIVRLMEALCGDNGVGLIRRQLILKRLQTSLYETRYMDLDTVYSQIFALPRLKAEQYSYSEDSLLLWSDIQDMDMKDAMYRQRIWAYMLSFQYGGTVKGLSLAGQAATGLRCEVADGMMYFRSGGVSEEYQDYVSGEPLNYNRTIDFNGVTILVDTDGELTSEQRYNLSTVTARLRPVDVHYTFMTRSELMKDLCFYDREDEYVKPEVVEESSHWWSIARMVTGRPDWGVPLTGDNWIEANVTKEAPQQLLVNSQESGYDFTPMVTSVTASTEHVGKYNKYQREIFKSLAIDGAETTKGALNALAQSSSRHVAGGYYGDALVIDGAYPSDYSSKFTRFFTEIGRSHRYWSSEERGVDEDESLVFEIKRIVPINRISLAIYRKPLRIRIYLSSYKDENGEREWVEAKNAEKLPVVYVNKGWGNTDSGELLAIDFDIRRAYCDAVKITFERLDVDYYASIPDHVYETYELYRIDEFKWSVECSDVSVQYIVRTEDDYLPATYEDMFGNRVDTELRLMTADRAVDDDDRTYWISQPNVGENAVEYLILKISDTPKRINFVELNAIYAGCQMNVYSTDRSKPGWWTPYPKIYQFQSGRTYLPMRKVTYIKLEFTMLCATPYDVKFGDIPVVTRLFPWDVKKYMDDREGEGSGLTVDQQLLMPAGALIYDDGTPENIIGIEDLYIREDALSMIEPDTPRTWGYDGFTFNEMYRMYQDSALHDIYGDDMAMEGYDVPTPDATAFENGSVYYRFPNEGKHEYEIETFFRTQDLAYVVGIKDVTFGFSGCIFSTQEYPSFFMYMHDDRYIDVNDGWYHVRDERLQVTRDDRLNYFETPDLQCLYPFRTFEMVTNQKKPVEKFAHPSDMVHEWHGWETDVHSVEMGLSGTVLMAEQAEPGMGIESEPKLTRSMSIAKARVDVFPMVAGDWIFECYDLFGETVFNLKYSLEAQKWQSVIATFVPMPGGTWWDSDYPYRVQIPIKGPVSRGACVFIPVVDFDALWRNGMLDSGLTKLRLTFYDGVNAREIPLEITDNMEMWFRLQQDIPSGYEANGKYDFDRRVFYGAYHLYFGPTVSLDEPKRDYRDVFDHGPYTLVSDVSWLEVKDKTWGELSVVSWEFGDFRVKDDGTVFQRPNDRLEVEDEFFLPDKGFVSFEVTLDTPLLKMEDIANTVIAHRWDDFYNIMFHTWREYCSHVPQTWYDVAGLDYQFLSGEHWDAGVLYSYDPSGDVPWSDLLGKNWGNGVLYDRDPSLDKTWGELLNWRWGSTGRADVRFLMDYKDKWKRIQCYTYERQLVFVVRDANGFESSFVSADEGLLQAGVKSHVLLEWDVPGTADVIRAQVYRWAEIATLSWGDMDSRTWDRYKRDENGFQVKSVDTGDKKRRWLGVWVDSATQLRCIPNVYDEKWYWETDKVY